MHLIHACPISDLVRVTVKSAQRLQEPGINPPIPRSVDDRPPEANVRHAMLQPVGGANAKLIGCHPPKMKETRKETLFWCLFLFLKFLK